MEQGCIDTCVHTYPINIDIQVVYNRKWKHKCHWATWGLW